jgi:transposase
MSIAGPSPGSIRDNLHAIPGNFPGLRQYFEDRLAWAQTRQTNGFLEALNGLFRSAKRRARGFTRLSTIRTVIFLIAGKLNFQTVNPHAA